MTRSVATLVMLGLVGAAVIAGLAWYRLPVFSPRIAVEEPLVLVRLVWYPLSPVEPTSEERVEFEVEPGWSAARIASELERSGLIRDSDVLSLYLRLYQLDRDLGEGVYTLSPSMSVPMIARRLTEGGLQRVTSVVIPEGFRMVDIAARLAERGFGDEEVLLGLMREPSELRPVYVPEGSSLEGYLFPARYDFPLDGTPTDVIRVMLRRFDQELSVATVEQLARRGLIVHEWVTLGSMVQSEAGGDDEMAIIAGVFLNRLELGMRLQSDPTVAYGLGKDLPELNFGAGDFDALHPWNTYRYAGLPAGPISNPGSAALRAVLEPQPTNAAGEPYLYFLHGRDGTFRPNLNLTDHNRDVQEYLR
ncbi:MAG: endolytic transglycosylase MltG [Trueperaceae bacterium]|nr:endolytic transglycosylase MltG [Trueperaceae bacterium]